MNCTDPVRLVRVGLVLALAVLAGTAFAGCGEDASKGRCQNVTITRLFPTSAGHVYVATSGDESMLNCAAHEGIYLWIDGADPGADRLYSALLTAFTMGRSVRMIRIVDGSAKCRINYLWLD